MTKVLFVATSDIHVQTFHLPYLKWLRENGCTIHLAVENRGNLEIPHTDRTFHLPFPRTPFHFANIRTLRRLKGILAKEHYDLVHCHTPIPSMLARLAARRQRKNGTKVLYTAHGFHFYKGGPLRNWLLYFPAEYLLSAFTDGIVTINAEDYWTAQKRLLNTHSFYIKGIGVDSSRFKTLSEAERQRIREELGYGPDSFILLYIAEFIYRKNHRFLVHAVPELIKHIPKLKVLFAGTGVLLDETRDLARELGVEDHVEFLGFRNDVSRLAGIADVGISSSRQEGLGLGLAEEMLCSVPVVATEDRGHKEMIIHGENGYFFPQGGQKEFVSRILELYKDAGLRKRMAEKSLERAQLFRIERSLDSMAGIYQKFLN